MCSFDRSENKSKYSRQSRSPQYQAMVEIAFDQLAKGTKEGVLQAWLLKHKLRRLNKPHHNGNRTQIVANTDSGVCD